MVILRKPEHFWPVVWGAVAFLLALVIVAEYEFGRVTVGEGTRSPAKVAEAKLLPAFVLPPDGEAGPEIVARPLFVPTRRPAPPAAAAAVSTMKRGQFVLTGVTVTPDVSIAFLKEVANGKTLGVKKGAQANGLTVETVEPRRVVLKQGDELEELSLNVQVPARVAAAPAPPPPAPGMPLTGGAPPAAGATPPGTVNPQGVPAGSGLPTNVPGAQPAQPGSPAPATGRRRPWINTQ